MFLAFVVLIVSFNQVERINATTYILPQVGITGNGLYSMRLIFSNHYTPYLISVNASLFDNNTIVTSCGATVQPDTVKSCNLAQLDAETLLDGSEIANRSLKVTSNDIFNLHVIYEYNGHKEGFAAIPTSNLGNEYYVSTFCDLGGYCQIAIATTVSGITRVYVKLPDDVDEVFICVGNEKWRSEFDTSFNLTYPETLQFETTHDLTGTYVYADKAISVLAATRSMPAQDGTTLVHFSEQLLPVDDWGTEFVVKGFDTPYGCVVHITSHEPRTFLEMSGFRTVELSGFGKTLKRRVEKNGVSYIKSSKPIQVMVFIGVTYGSNDTVTSVAMTLLPATEHFNTSYVAACDYVNTTFQYVYMEGDSIDNITGVQVPFTMFEVCDVSPASNGVVVSALGLPFSGIMICDTAAFPMGPLFKTQATCEPNIKTSFPGDGIDNDCSFGEDEALCFENVKITSTFIPDVSTKISAYKTDVTAFYEILLRVQSCGTTQIELGDYTGDKYLIHFSRSQILAYKCNSTCNNPVLSVNTLNVLQNSDCAKDVISYWMMMDTDGRLCVNLGYRNFGGNCDYVPIKFSLDESLVNMTVSSIMSNATIWYDLYRQDCAKLKSDWRCDDLIYNCLEYGRYVCTNVSFIPWSDIYCRKFCGKCAPDSYGKMFVYYPSQLQSQGYIEDLYIVGNINSSYPRLGIQWDDKLFTTFQQNVSQSKTILVSSFTDTDKPVFIFSEENVAIYYKSGGVNGSLNVLQPVDALGMEYMSIAFVDFNETLTCYIVALGSGTSVQVFTPNKTITYADFTAFYELFNQGEQTGTIISGNKPFTVFCGTDGTSTYGPSWFQLPATNTWDVKYITPKLGTSVGLYIQAKIKVVTNSGNTVIEVHGDFDGIYLLSQRGDWKEFDTSPHVAYTITSNFPVAVAIMFYNNLNYKRSSFHIIPPTKSFIDQPEIIFIHRPGAIFKSFTETESDGSVTEDNITATYGYFRSKKSETLALYFEELSDSNIVTSMSTTFYRDLYNNQICRFGRGSGAGDGIDSDCDWQADEESVCYTGYGTLREDHDLDGGFGEDCLTSQAGTSSVPVPIEPICTPQSEQPLLGSCWQNCQCKCSWMQNLNTYNKMNDSQKQAYNLAQTDEIQKNLDIDESSLSSTQAELVSAEDRRTSSTSIGVAGVIFIILVIGLVVAFDIVNIVLKIKEAGTQTEVANM